MCIVCIYAIIQIGFNGLNYKNRWISYIKILIVNKFLYSNGGSETYIFSLSEILKSKGNDVSFFGMQDDRNTVTNDLDLHVNKMDFHKANALQKIFALFKIVYSFEAKNKMKKVIKAYKPDIIHINNFNFQLTPSVLYAAIKSKIPVVMTIHDYQLLCPNHMMYIEKSDIVCEKCKGGKYINCIKNKCIHDSKLRSIIGAFEGFLYKKLNTYNKTIDRFIAPSKFLADKFTENGYKDEKITFIHNFLNVVETELFDKKEYVLYFGRLSKQKGIETLVRVAKINPNIKFVVAGIGPLEEIVNDVENIDYVGFIKGKALEQLIGQALFSIYPSEWYENCPLSVLESQALGTPVIGSNIGGIPELIDNNNDGLLFESGNVSDLSNCIQKLYNDRRLLKSYSIKCKEKAQKFNADSYYKRIMKIYKDAIVK